MAYLVAVVMVNSFFFWLFVMKSHFRLLFFLKGLGISHVSKLHFREYVTELITVDYIDYFVDSDFPSRWTCPHRDGFFVFLFFQ